MLARRTATPKSSTLQFNLMEETLTSTEVAQLRGSSRRRRRKGVFVGGPFPWPQFKLAVQLPGRALAVWQLVHHQVRMTHKEEVTLPKGLLADCGIDRDANRRALAALEQVGLISVVRNKGRSVRVSLTELRSDEEDV